MKNEKHAQKILKEAGIDINALSDSNYFKRDVSGYALGILVLLKRSNLLTESNLNLILKKIGNNNCKFSQEHDLYCALHILFNGSETNSNPYYFIGTYSGYLPLRPSSGLSKENLDRVMTNTIPKYAAALIRLFIENNAAELIPTYFEMLDVSRVDKDNDDEDRAYLLNLQSPMPSNAYRFNRDCFEAERHSIRGFKILHSARLLNEKTAEKLLERIKVCRLWLADADNYLSSLKSLHKNKQLTEPLFKTVSDHKYPVTFTRTYLFLLTHPTEIEPHVWLAAISNIKCSQAFLYIIPMLHQHGLLTMERLNNIPQLRHRHLSKMEPMEPFSELYQALVIIQLKGVQLSSDMYDTIMACPSSRYAAGVICYLMKKMKEFQKEDFNIIYFEAKKKRSDGWGYEYNINNHIFGEFERLVTEFEPEVMDSRFDIERDLIDKLYLQKKQAHLLPAQSVNNVYSPFWSKPMLQQKENVEPNSTIRCEG